MSDDVLRLTGDAMRVDMDTFTLDEIDAIETIIDGPIDVLGQADIRKGKVLRAIAVVMKHRDDPGGYPIDTPAELEETRRKIGRLRIVVESPVTANGGPPPLPGPDAAAVPHASSSPPVSAATSGA